MTNEEFWKNCHYPAVGITPGGFQVEFTSYRKGTVIATTNKSLHSKGYTSTNWSMSGFTYMDIEPRHNKDGYIKYIHIQGEDVLNKFNTILEEHNITKDCFVDLNIKTTFIELYYVANEVKVLHQKGN